MLRLSKLCQDYWNVVGRYDFLAVGSIDHLSEVENKRRQNAIGNEKAVLRGTGTDLLLFPSTEADRRESIFEAIESPKPSDEYPLLALVSFSLAPAAYEIGSDYKDVLRNRDRIIESLRSEISLLDVEYKGFFSSLSAPDIVFMCLPSSVEHLYSLDSFQRGAASDRLSKYFRGATPKAHAFSRVESVLAFNGAHKTINHLSTGHFSDTAGNNRLPVSFRIRTDCGHFSDVAAAILQVGSDVRFQNSQLAEHPDGEQIGHQQGICWNDYTVCGEFLSFAAFVRVWDQLWMKDAWREGNIIDTESSLVFSETVDSSRAESHDHQSELRAWELKRDVMDTLSNIRRSLSEFATGHFGLAQQSELLRLYDLFHTCFLKADLVGTARDLLPFFRQLGRLVELTKEWDRYKIHRVDIDDAEQKEHIVEVFAKSTRDLLSFASRAVMNRIEHRTARYDPSFLNTLDVGASNLLGGYTVAFYLCWELFRKSRAYGTSEAEPHCTAEHFAACVCAGGEGRVVCVEAFEDMRRYIEEKELRESKGSVAPFALHNQLTDAESTPDISWTSRITLLDVSGDVLLRPDESFVHCLHEAAELTNWASRGGPSCQEFRKEINSIITLDASDILTDLVMSQYDTIKVNRRNTVYFILFAVVRSWMHENPDVQPDRSHLGQLHNLILSEYEPVHFVEYLFASLLRIADETQVGRNFEKYYSLFPSRRNPENTDLGLEFPELLKQVTLEARGVLFRKAKNRVGLITEILADIGMWAAFDHLHCQTQPIHSDSRQSSLERTQSDRLDDAHRIYESIMRAAASARGQKFPPPTDIVWRWQLIASTLAHRDAAIRQPGLEAEIKERSQRICREYGVEMTDEHFAERVLTKRCRYLFGADGRRRRLTTLLRTYSAFGGTKQLDFPNLTMDFLQPEQDLFERFITSWKTNGDEESRVEFAFHLWAKSLRLGFNQVFQEKSTEIRPATE